MAAIIPLTDIRAAASAAARDAFVRAAASGPPLRCPSVDMRRQAAARPAHLGHGPLQFPLRLLHAEGRLRLAIFQFLPHAELLTFEEITRVAGSSSARACGRSG